MEKKKEGEGKENKKKVKKNKKEIEFRYGMCVKVGGARVVVNNKKIWEKYYLNKKKCKMKQLI